MIKKTAIYDILFIVLLTFICHLLFSKYGFNPTDEGFVLSTTNRILHGQIPHVDFSSVRPVGYAILHIPELLFSNNYVYLISRFVFWLEQVLIAYFWLRFIIVYSKNEIKTIPKHLLIAICLMLNVHYFPTSVLHTIDGLLMCLIGLNLVISEKKQALIGFFLIGFAALCKQNYILFLPVSILLFGRQNYLKNILAGILPILFYISIIYTFGGFQQLKIQLFAHHELIQVGILSYIKSRLFFAGIIMACLLAFIQNNSLKILFLFILNSILIYALITNRYHEKFSFLILGATLGCLMIPIMRKQVQYIKLFLVSILLAWSVSISVGYNSPALFLGGGIILIAFYISVVSPTFSHKLSIYLSIIILPLAIAFYFVRLNTIYRDAPTKQLTYKLDNIVEGAYGIYTNLNTFKVLVELDLIKKKIPNCVVLPDFTACNILHSHQSKIFTEWPNKTEIPNKEILQFITQKLEKDSTDIVMPKYNTATLSYGFQKVPQNKTKDFLILDDIFTHYKKTTEYSYFDVFEINNTTLESNN